MDERSLCGRLAAGAWWARPFSYDKTRVHGSHDCLRRISARPYKIAEIQPRHFQALADRYPDATAWPAMVELAGRVDSAIDQVEKRLPKGFAESVCVPIFKGARDQAKKFLSYAKA